MQSPHHRLSDELLLSIYSSALENINKYHPVFISSLYTEIVRRKLEQSVQQPPMLYE
ncbi:sporulation histidine kinase inhibitor Sda [Gorillibacterium sp. sgz5001074]|uniref:sporulation histidine kinase inhibitor Sda n=1 Tax=Gorillibacterium sp. sgz5001074 TaxID=3446695 RepID=UPI003F6716C2